MKTTALAILLLNLVLVGGCGKEKLKATDASNCKTVGETYKKFQACAKIGDAQRQQGEEKMSRVEITVRMSADRANDQAAANVAANTCRQSEEWMLEQMKGAGCN